MVRHPGAPKNLGEVLLYLRELKGESLRAVEKATGLSNAYISQLENDAIKEPSPRVLHILARHYGVPYTELLKLAGYLELPEQYGDPFPGGEFAEGATQFLFHGLKNLTPDERAAVIEFAKFLRQQREVRSGDKTSSRRRRKR